jgi:methylmalonyl-CoA mutase C-terminal domain/subunit
MDPVDAGRADGRTRPIRVVLTKVGLDGHDRGVKVIAQALRDAGMEVIYAGLRRTPDDIARIVLEEDADVLGLSILSGAVVPLTRRVREALAARQVDDVLVVVGGIVPDAQRAELAAMGVEGVFTPGTALSAIVDHIRGGVPQERSYREAP